MTQADLEVIAADPRAYLRRCHRTEARIRVKEKRIARLYQVSTQITSTVKAVSAYTGPSDKIGNCVLEIVSLQEEISSEAENLVLAERETEAAIRELVPDVTQRAVLEARYLAQMSWEQIAYEFHYAYRWTLKIHQRALNAMKTEAEKRRAQWDETAKT